MAKCTLTTTSGHKVRPQTMRRYVVIRHGFKNGAPYAYVERRSDDPAKARKWANRMGDEVWDTALKVCMFTNYPPHLP